MQNFHGKRFKPTSPGLRHRVAIGSSNLSKSKPKKFLCRGLIKTGGRNHHGRITVRHRGGGHKRKIRFVDGGRSVGKYSESVVRLLEYDPNRGGHLALCQVLKTNKFFYILAGLSLKVGDIVKGLKINNEGVEGSGIRLKFVPVGSKVFNLETKQGEGSRLSKSAGAYSLVVKNLDSGKVLVRLPSKKTKVVSGECLAYKGQVSNLNFKNVKLGKAGVSRHLGVRPTVRGSAMNAVDHPHGGKTRGSGRKGGQPRTP